ncbi:DUF6950 family protein [Euryhalocaulis caribicus]|uniref:DUF6950 family protein n=1 Tax=Euryhalocaulis caribicus TaxID=1161401 RepID=UPI00039FC388|nr:hypothetical protein [Euryhalocaulis caribicus]
MKRREDWEQRLHAWHRETLNVPHDWGRNNCAFRAAGAIKAMTGEDLAKGFRVKVRSKKGFTKLMRDEGWDTLEDIADAFLTRTERPLRGDLVMLEGPNGDFFGIKVGKTAVGPTQRGLEHVSMLQMKAAWRVGENA